MDDDARAPHAHDGEDGVPLCDSARRAWQMVGERDGQLERLTERLRAADLWSARWKAVATRYRRMLAVHRDRAAGREEG